MHSRRERIKGNWKTYFSKRKELEQRSETTAFISHITEGINKNVYSSSSVFGRSSFITTELTNESFSGWLSDLFTGLFSAGTSPTGRLVLEPEFSTSFLCKRGLTIYFMLKQKHFFILHFQWRYIYIYIPLSVYRTILIPLSDA